VVPGPPHHVTQRGNRRQQTFFCDDDYVAYLYLMAEWCGEQGVEIWAYCLMTNHAHLAGHSDRLAIVAPMLAMVHDWRSFLDSAIREKELRDLRDHGRTGRPLGSADFVDRLERLVGRTLGPKKPGRKPKLLKQP